MVFGSGRLKKNDKKKPKICPIGSMFGIFTYIWLISMGVRCEIVCIVFFVGWWVRKENEQS